jgi:hypothetical protein
LISLEIISVDFIEGNHFTMMHGPEVSHPVPILHTQADANIPEQVNQLPTILDRIIGA